MFIEKEKRPEMLKEMDNHIRKNVNNENLIVDLWLSLGVPDGATEQDYQDAVEDEEYWTDCLEIFARVIMRDNELERIGE